jgi:hypothetical protein
MRPGTKQVRLGVLAGFCLVVGLLAVPLQAAAQGNRPTTPPRGPPTLPKMHDRGGPPFAPPGPPPNVPPVNPPGHNNLPANSSMARAQRTSHALTLGSALEGTSAGAVHASGLEVRQRLESLTLLNSRGEKLPAPTLLGLLELLDGARTMGLPERLAASPGEARAAAVQLEAALNGLFAAPWTLGDVVAAYNAFIDASPVATLTDPPPELLAIRALLHPLIEAARAHERTTRAGSGSGR